ncbi:guanylate-binding protein 3-like [Leptodactylus fuscus]|uniref:guanylate-binding protein 3-like n=1 Tax=Leptodactylus fuscus TaxID=238119 RepID=UPI003F4E7D5F
MDLPVCLIENTAGGKLQVNARAIDILSKISQPLVVVAIVGPCQTGKSYLMNKLTRAEKGFALGSTVQAQTKGIWMQCLPHPTKEDHTLVLLDTEGLGDIMKGDKKNDMWIFCLAILLSSTLIYNSKASIDENALEKLHLVGGDGPSHLHGNREFAAASMWETRFFFEGLYSDEGRDRKTISGEGDVGFLTLSRKEGTGKKGITGSSQLEDRVSALTPTELQAQQSIQRDAPAQGHQHCFFFYRDRLWAYFAAQASIIIPRDAGLSQVTSVPSLKMTNITKDYSEPQGEIQGSLAKVKRQNKYKDRIRMYFMNRKCFMFDLPSGDKEVLQNMDKVSDDQLSQTFMAQTKKFCDYIYNKSEVKYVDDVHEVTGKILANLATKYIEAINSSKAVCMEDVMAKISEAENRRAVEEAAQHYENRMKEKIKFPIETADQILKISGECEKEARNIFLKRSIKDKEFKFHKQFLEITEQKEQEFFEKNEKESRENCKKLIKTLGMDMENCLDQRVYETSGGYQKLKEDIKGIEEKYKNYSRKGTKAEEVLQEFKESKEPIIEVIMRKDNALSYQQRKMEEEKARREKMEKKRRLRESQESENDKKKEHQKMIKEENVKEAVEKEKDKRTKQEEIILNIISDRIEYFFVILLSRELEQELLPENVERMHQEPAGKKACSLAWDLMIVYPLPASPGGSKGYDIDIPYTIPESQSNVMRNQEVKISGGIGHSKNGEAQCERTSNRWKNENGKTQDPHKSGHSITIAPPHQNLIVKRTTDGNISIIRHQGKEKTLSSSHQNHNV